MEIASATSPRVADPASARRDTQAQAVTAITLLARILKEEDVAAVTEAGNRRLLTGEQVDMLGRLYRYFVGDNDGEEGEEGGEEEKDGRQNQPSRRKAKKRRAEMLRLADEVQVREGLQEFLDGPGATVKGFLGGEEDGDQEVFIERLEECWQDEDPGAAANICFGHCVKYLEDLEKSENVNSARKCFMWLFFFDLTQHLNVVRNTTHSGRRMGAKMKQDTLTLISGDFYRKVFARPEDEATVKDKVEKWTRRGLKLAQLCDEFGEGALLILAGKLSEDMLDNKYREGGQNATHLETFRLLHQARLKEIGEEHGATDLGRKVREFLMSGWKAEPGAARLGPLLGGTASPEPAQE